MAFMTWEPSFSVNDEELDRQHMRLVGLINSLHEAVAAGTPRPAMDRIASDVAMYARFHFRKEESLMAQHGYPAVGQHTREHAECTASLDGVMRSLLAGQQPISEADTGFMKDWLRRHLLESDSCYAAHLVSSRAA